jgi:WXG100 family type VII secretion target
VRGVKMARQIEIDLNKLTHAQTAYTRVATDLNSSIRGLDSALEMLKNSGWSSEASNAFFMHYDSSWKENMNKRVRMLEHVKSCLQKAQSEYTAIYNELNSVSL